jgi:hypothetical protein
MAKFYAYVMMYYLISSYSLIKKIIKVDVSNDILKIEQASKENYEILSFSKYIKFSLFLVVLFRALFISSCYILLSTGGKFNEVTLTIGTIYVILNVIFLMKWILKFRDLSVDNLKTMIQPGVKLNSVVLFSIETFLVAIIIFL